jgi:hypothetical protein
MAMLSKITYGHAMAAVAAFVVGVVVAKVRK